MSFDDHDTQFTLNNQARPLGLWIGIHKSYDPLLGGGPFFVMPRKTAKDQRSPTLLRYATAERVEEFLRDQVENSK